MGRMTEDDGGGWRRDGGGTSRRTGVGDGLWRAPLLRGALPALSKLKQSGNRCGGRAVARCVFGQGGGGAVGGGRTEAWRRGEEARRGGEARR